MGQAQHAKWAISGKGELVRDPLSGDGARNQVSGVGAGAVQGRDFQGNTIHLHSGGAQTPRPRQLPRDVSCFTGRRRDMSALDSLLDESTSRSVTMIVSAIAGAAGVGKTALAVHWAHRVRDRFPDGDLYVNLQGYGPGRPLLPGDVLDGFLTALGTAPERIPREVESRAAMFRTLVDGRRMLIVLDNANSAEQVRPMLPGSRGPLVVITSRSRLAGLVARDDAFRVHLDLLAPDEASMLLGKIVGPDRIAAESEAAIRIAQFCAHLPLALRITAEYLAAHPRRPLAELAQTLAGEDNRLDVLAAGDDETTAVRNVFSWSYRALRPELARTFRLSGLHAGPDMSIDAIAALTGTGTVATRRLVDGVAAVHLIEEPADGRYRFHDLLRVYAGERAIADESGAARKEAVERVLLWYLHATSAARTVLTVGRPRTPLMLPSEFGLPPASAPVFTGHREALAWCDAELANIEAAIGQAAEEGRDDVACWLPVVLQPYFQRRNPFRAWVATHTAGLDAARSVNDAQAEAELNRGIGGAYYYQGRFEESYEHQRRALDGYRALGWDGEIILVNLGSVCAALERYDESFVHLREALGLSRRTGHRNAEGFALQSMGATCQRLNRFEESVPYCRDAAEVFRETGDRFGFGIALARLAYAFLRQRKMPESIDCLRQALGNSRDIGDHPGEAWLLETLGTATYEIGQKESALENWRDALRLYERLLDNDGAARVRTQLSGPAVPLTTPLPRL
ncbi:ATP-binding protein [Streptomyces sp. NPDC060002]|uniref:ATP-binding protein n=1 Tax=Streptomyces sp. NPDC060002 TaxID=3347033 RepID=UPI0036BBD91E